MMDSEEKVPTWAAPADKSGKDIKPQNLNVVAENITTIGADFAQVMLDFDTMMCTLQFSRTHPKPKQVDGRLTIEGITTEAFLEVKIPLKKAFQAAEFIHDILVKTQGADEHGYKYFGPVFHEGK